MLVPEYPTLGRTNDINIVTSQRAGNVSARKPYYGKDKILKLI